MNDLLRPSIYQSYHEILPVDKNKTLSKKTVDVVGPICESGDFLAKDRELLVPQEGEYIFIRSCGAYASSMAFNYNSRTKSAEVLVDGNDVKLIRRRETLEDLWRLES
jgi:diaminopimelate decarboxylase